MAQVKGGDEPWGYGTIELFRINALFLICYYESNYINFYFTSALRSSVDINAHASQKPMFLTPIVSNTHEQLMQISLIDYLKGSILVLYLKADEP